MTCSRSQRAFKTISILILMIVGVMAYFYFFSNHRKADSYVEDVKTLHFLDDELILSLFQEDTDISGMELQISPVLIDAKTADVVVTLQNNSKKPLTWGVRGVDFTLEKK